MRTSTLALTAAILLGVIVPAAAQTLRFDDRGFSFRFNKDDRRGDVQGKLASCELYALIAAVQADANDRNRCGYRGPQWSNNMEPHFRWCRFASRSDLSREQFSRSQQLQDCFNRLGDFDDRR